MAISLIEMYAAWHAFYRGKRPSRVIDEFHYDLEKQLDTLWQEITERTYRHGSYQTVIVREKKERRLAVAPVRDRIVHRLVYDQLTHEFDRSFDPDVWSCRRGKGLHGCLTRTQRLIEKHSEAYAWRMDITKFFDNTDHQVLQDCLRRRLQDQQTLWLCDAIIDSYHHHEYAGGWRGIPIGNLTSQIFANIYLNELDRYIRHEEKPLAYVRYGDDTVVWCRTRREAEQIRRRTIAFLKDTLYLAVNPKNDVIVPVHAGLHFLGHVVTRSYVVVDRHTTRAVLGKATSRSIASYKSLLLAKTPKNRLDWQYADELEGLGIL